MTHDSSGLLGLIHLEALHNIHTTSNFEQFLHKFGWSQAEIRSRSLSPPQALGVVVPLFPAWHGKASQMLKGYLPWIQQAQHIILIISIEKTTMNNHHREGYSKNELHNVYEKEIKKMVHFMAFSPAQVLFWDGSQPSLQSIKSALKKAKSLAENELPSKRIEPLPGSNTADHCYPSGPWMKWTTEKWGGLASICRSVCIRENIPAIYDSASSTLQNLITGDPILHLPDIQTPAAFSPDGKWVLGRSTPTAENLIYGPLIGKKMVLPNAHQTPISIDPSTGIGVVGGRCRFQWIRLFQDGQVSWWTDALHQWPCGHEKKLHGYLDNEPVRIDWTSDREAYLSIYDVDAVIGSAIGFSWCRAGSALIPQIPQDDPVRTLYTIPDWSYADGEANESTLIHNDCRGDAPAIALGPEAAFRYVLGFDREVWRIQRDSAYHIAGPDEGYGVFDQNHHLQCHRKGRLICGFGHYCWIEDDGHLFREDIKSGERWHCGEVQDSPADGIAIKGTKNALLIQISKDSIQKLKEENSPRRIPFFHQEFSIKLC